MDRLVWTFPIRPVPDNDVKKPSMFVFKDMEDYKIRGQDVDAVYNAELKVKGKKPTMQRGRHKKFGERTVVETKGELIVVQFKTVGRKQLNLQVCLDKGLMEFA